MHWITRGVGRVPFSLPECLIKLCVISLCAAQDHVTSYDEAEPGLRTVNIMKRRLRWRLKSTKPIVALSSLQCIRALSVAPCEHRYKEWCSSSSPGSLAKPSIPQGAQKQHQNLRMGSSADAHLPWDLEHVAASQVCTPAAGQVHILPELSLLPPGCARPQHWVQLRTKASSGRHRQF